MDGTDILSASSGLSCISLIVDGVGGNDGLAAVLNDPEKFHRIAAKLGGKQLNGVDGVHSVSMFYS